MFASYGSDDKVVAMTVEQPASAADGLVVQDLEIACSRRWQSPVTADPFGDTADRFEQARVHQEEHNFDRYQAIRLRAIGGTALPLIALWIIIWTAPFGSTAIPEP
jgi:hypothetical protein